MPQAHTRHHRHLELAESVWFACLEATDVPYALTGMIARAGARRRAGRARARRRRRRGARCSLRGELPIHELNTFSE